jgi:hypothetical protein
MTVSVDTSTSGPFVGNGVTVAFPYTFKAKADEQVRVIADGLTVSDTLYTVTRNVNDNGGTVTFAAAPTADEIMIQMVPDFAQDISFTNAGPFLASSHDDALDAAAMRSIYLKDRVDALAPSGLLSVASRAGYYPSWDAEGNPVFSSGTGSDAGLRTDLAASAGGALVGVRSGSVQAALDSLGTLVEGYALLADGDDIGPAIQRAIDAGHDDIVLRGQNWLRSPVVADRVIRLWGNGWEESPTPGAGTWLMIDDDSFDPFTFDTTDAAGFQARGFAVWQEHPPLGPGWTPTDYPPVFTVTDLAGGCYLDDIYFANVNKWVYSVGAGRTSWGRIVGMALRYGFYIDNALDACHGEHIHCWPFGYAADPDYGEYAGAWTSANADLFVLGRVDTPQMGNIFALGCRSVFRITETVSGIPSKISFGIVNADNCKYALYDPEGINSDGIGDDDGPQGWDFQGAVLTHQGLQPGIEPATPIDGARAIYSTSDFVNGQIGTYFGEYHDRHDVEASGASFYLQIGNFKSDLANQDNGGYGRFLLTGASSNVQIMQADLQGAPVGPLNDPSSTQNITYGGNVTVLPGDNHNDVRINQGVATIAVASSSVVVPHGLSMAPNVQDIQLTPLSNLGGSGIAYFWVSAADADDFTISVNTNVATIGINFAWLARIPGAG